MLRNPERAAVYTFDEVVKAAQTAGRRNKSTLPDGRTFSRTSQRLKLFFSKGPVCIECGVVGNTFSMERESGTNHPFHLNLYAVTENGKWILMTKDHIVPKSKGGASELANYNTMCSPCNFRKGNITD